MKKLLQILALSFSLCGCAMYSGYYNVGLSKVVNPGSNKKDFGKMKITDLSSKSSLKYCYEDSVLNITWDITPFQINFKMLNKTDHSIKIIWDESTFVDIDGNSSKIIHAGVRYLDRNNSQPPSIVASHSYLDDLVQPSKNIFMGSIYSGWKQLPILPNASYDKDELISMTNKYTGKQMKVVLPIQIENTTNEYEFDFDIRHFTPNR